MSKYPVLCAWCGKVIRRDGQTPDSHGVCSKCKQKMIKEIENGNR